MNHHDDSVLSPIDDPRRAIIDALLDGEAVDKEAVREALGQPDTRDYFIDLLLLRRLAIDMGPNTFQTAGRPLTPTARGLRWLAAAAVVITTAAGGYLVGRDQPVPRRAGEAHVVVAPTTAPRAPAPTHTIRFEPGTNWIATLQGN